MKFVHNRRHSSHWRGAVERVRRALTAVGRNQSGLYAIEGIRLHERALHAGITLELTLLADSLVQDKSVRIQTLLANLQGGQDGLQATCEAGAGQTPRFPANLYPLPDALLAELTHGRDLGRLISLVKIPPEPDLAQLLLAAPHPLLLVAAEVVDPGNVGAMVRTGHAGGITAFVAVGASDPFHPKAVRTSMGSLFKTAVCRYQTVEPLLVLLRRLEIGTVGAVAAGGQSLPQATFTETGTAVFLGNEYQGLSENIVGQLDRRLTIPMHEGIDSLSVNAATAVILYEICRRR